MGDCLPLSVFFFDPSVAPLATVPLGFLFSVNLLGFFSPPGVLRVSPESKDRFPWAMAFLFPEGRLVAPDSSFGGDEGPVTPTPGCTGALPAELSLSDSPGPDPGSGIPATGPDEGGGGPNSPGLSAAPPGPS